MAFGGWGGLCFGSVVLGIAIIILAPHLLMLPLPIGIAGVGFFALGLACFGDSEVSSVKNSTVKPIQTSPKVVHVTKEDSDLARELINDWISLPTSQEMYDAIKNTDRASLVLAQTVIENTKAKYGLQYQNSGMNSNACTRMFHIEAHIKSVLVV